MQRLSGFDASMLSLEIAQQPMTGCALWELDTSAWPGGYTFDRFRDRLLARMPALPEFRMKLADSAMNLDTPVWVDDPEFDLDRHLHRVDLPPPGARKELTELLGSLMSERMNRGRPLWDMWVIEGLSDGDPGFSGKVAVVHRMHHVLGDGTAALAILSRLCGAAADSPPPAPRGGIGTISRRHIVFDGLLRFALRPWFLITRALPGIFAALINMRAVRRAARGRTLHGVFCAPHTLMNRSITARRSAAFVQLNLADVKAVKNKFGVTVNDVTLAVASGALRQFLLDRDALPKESLIALMAVSVYRSDRADRNQLSAARTSLRSDLADPVDRLKAIAADSAFAKANLAAIGPRLLQDLLALSPGLAGLAIRLYRRFGLGSRRKVCNLTISNVPGPQDQCFLLGAAVRARYAFGPVFYGNGLNITAMSLNGKLDIGFVSCPDLLPDLSDLANHVPCALEKLLDAPA